MQPEVKPTNHKDESETGPKITQAKPAPAWQMLVVAGCFLGGSLSIFFYSAPLGMMLMLVGMGASKRFNQEG